MTPAGYSPFFFSVPLTAELHAAPVRQTPPVPSITYQDGSTYELTPDLPDGIVTIQFPATPQGICRKYEGPLVNGQMHGKGKMMWCCVDWNNDKIYEGDFIEGEITGEGTIIFSTGATYTGQFRDGELNGRGKIVWKDGSWYEGDFVRGERTGQGQEFIQATGELHIGYFIEGQKAAGPAITLDKSGRPKDFDYDRASRSKNPLSVKMIQHLVYENGDYYQGKLRADKKQGYGFFKNNAENFFYQGEFKEDQFHGKGLWFSRSFGHSYEGEYKQNKKHGQGTYTWPCIGKYEGQWVDDQMHGKGKMTYDNGTIYEGDFENDEPHGKGKYCYPDGSTYEGDVAHHLPHGNGRSHSETGVFQGVYENGEEAFGLLIFPDNDQYIGSFKHKKPDGIGKIIKADSSHELFGMFEKGEFKSCIELS